MSIESKTEKPFIEETFASFFFCSLQNQRGLNFLHLDEESSLRVCIVNAGPSSFQTITTTDPKQQATIVIDFSKAGGVRFTAPPEPVPGFDLFVDEAGPVITLVQTAYYWSWFAGEYLAVQLPGVIIAGESGSGEVSVTLNNLEAGINQSLSAILMRLRKTGAASTTRANWRHGNAVIPQDGGAGGELTKDSSNVLKLTLTNSSGFLTPQDQNGNYPSFYVMLADGYQPGFSSLMPPYDARKIIAATSDDSSWDVLDITTNGFPVWKLTPNKLNTGNSNYIELKLSNIICQSIDRADVIVYHLGITDQVDMYQVMQVRVAPAALLTSGGPGEQVDTSIQILSFSVSPETLNNINAPTQVLLSWNVRNAGFVTLSGFGVVDAVVTNQAVKVEQTTTFVLTAFSASLAEAISKSVTVEVNPSLASRIVAQKTIMMWSGNVNTIPQGWVICDGNNGTPNLTDRFIMGAGIVPPNASGSATRHTHNVPALIGAFSTSKAGSHSHVVPSAWYARGLSCGKWSGIDAGGDMRQNSTRTQNDGEHYHVVSVNFPPFTTALNEVDMRPAWYALYFIMKTGI